MSTTELQIVHAQAEVSRFVECCFEPDDIVEIVIANGTEKAWHTAAELSEPKNLARFYDANQSGKYITVGANPRTHKRASEIACFRCLFASWTTWNHTSWFFKTPGVWRADCRQRCEAAGLPDPTVAIGAGGDSILAWRLSQPMHDATLRKRLQISVPVRYVIPLPGFTYRIGHCIADTHRAEILLANPSLRHQPKEFTKISTLPQSNHRRVCGLFDGVRCPASLDGSGRCPEFAV